MNATSRYGMEYRPGKSKAHKERPWAVISVPSGIVVARRMTSGEARDLVDMLNGTER